MKAVYRGERRVGLRKAPEENDPTTRSGKPRKRRETADIDPGDAALFEALRYWRAGEAKRQHVPPYVIFPDRTLIEVAQTKPGSLPRRRMEIRPPGSRK